MEERNTKHNQEKGGRSKKHETHEKGREQGARSEPGRTGIIDRTGCCKHKFSLDRREKKSDVIRNNRL